jgi:hypothetical protein
MIKSKIGQRIIGLFVLSFGSGFTIWSWYTAMNEGYYYPKAAVIFPAFGVLGLSLLLFPLDPDHLMAVHGVEKPTRLSHYPFIWKVMLVVALAAGFGNWWLIANRM